MDFYHIPVTESSPNKDADKIPINSAYCGISILVMNPEISKPKQVIHPNIPQTLLELIPPLFFKNIVLQSNLEVF